MNDDDIVRLHMNSPTLKATVQAVYAIMRSKDPKTSLDDAQRVVGTALCRDMVRSRAVRGQKQTQARL